MLAGRARRNKMRHQRSQEDVVAEGGGGGGGGGGVPSPRPYAPAPTPNPRRKVSFGDSTDGGGGGGPTVLLASLDDDDPDAKPPLRRRSKASPAQVRRSSHLSDTSTREQLLENDEALKAELVRLERGDSQWRHPMGFDFLSALRILNAPADPVLSNTGCWIQPEELEDIPSMFDSYLNVNCLYYSLVGVLAIETSLWLPIPPPDAPEYAAWLIAVSRFCWAANGVWSFSAVVASFHILWCVYATPTWAKRRFVIDNSRAISVVYALGSPNFAMMLVGTITGVLGNVFTQEGFTKRDWISAVMGLGLGGIVTAIFVLCSGSLIAKVVRPWKVADENLRVQRRRWSDTTGRSVRGFFQNKKDGEDDGFHDIEDAGFGPLGMPLVAHKLCAAGLEMEMLRRAKNNEVLLDQLLQGAGVERAGDRLRVILILRDGPTAGNNGGGKVEMTSLLSGSLDDSFNRFEKYVKEDEFHENNCG
ncbi:hypothetical protein ACHAWF_001953 [Thalassiosira exigua]